VVNSFPPDGLPEDIRPLALDATLMAVLDIGVGVGETSLLHI
jgi:hypothetical protein